MQAESELSMFKITTEKTVIGRTELERYQTSSLDLIDNGQKLTVQRIEDGDFGIPLKAPGVIIAIQTHKHVVIGGDKFTHDAGTSKTLIIKEANYYDYAKIMEQFGENSDIGLAIADDRTSFFIKMPNEQGSSQRFSNTFARSADNIVVVTGQNGNYQRMYSPSKPENFATILVPGR